MEDRASKKFVQFAGSSREPLLLDLPAQALSPDEVQRAVRFFEEHRVRLTTWTVEGPGGKRREQSAFQLELGVAARAAEVAMRVFREVYRLSPEFKLEIIEG